MDRPGAERVLRLFESRGQLDRLPNVDGSAPVACLERARSRLAAAQVLVDAKLWESVYTTAYDAYRTAADSVLLALGYRVPATGGAHRIATDIAHAALQNTTVAFAPSTAERFGTADTSRSTSILRYQWTRLKATPHGRSSVLD